MNGSRIRSWGRSIGLLSTMALLIVLPLAGCARPAMDTVEAQEVPLITVMRGDIEDVVTATGNLEAERVVDLSFDIAGTVEEVLVEEGDRVTAGQVLARLDDTGIQEQIEQAELAVESARVSLGRSKEEPLPAEIDSARAALKSAEASLADLLEGPLELEVQQSELNVDSAKNSLWSQQASRDSTAGSDHSSDAQKDAAEAAVLNAEVAVQQARVQHEMLLEPPTAAELSSAEAQVASAAANLANLLEQPNENDVAAQELALAQQELSLAQAQADLEDTRLLAPMDGIVILADVKEGEKASVGGIVFSIANVNDLQISAQVDELDVARIAQGQKTVATFLALDDTEVAAEVRSIAMAGETTTSGVAYDVKLALTSDEAALRLGMTADVEIIVNRAEDVLLVPNQAIEEDREEGTYYATEKTATGTKRVELELGLRSEDYSQVLNGLEEGDQVQLIVATDTGASEGMSGAMPFGPGGGR